MSKCLTLSLPILFVLLVGADGCADRCDQAKKALDRAAAIVTALELIDDASPQFNLAEIQEARAILAQAEILVEVFCSVPDHGFATAEPTDQEIQDHKFLLKKIRRLERSAGL